MKHDADHVRPVAFLGLDLWPLVGFLQISWLPESKSHSAIIRCSQTKKISGIHRGSTPQICLVSTANQCDHWHLASAKVKCIFS